MPAAIFPFPFVPRPQGPEVAIRDEDDRLCAIVRSPRPLPFLLDAVGLARDAAGTRALDWGRCIVVECGDRSGHVYEIEVPHAA